MTKAELVEAIRAEAGIGKGQAEAAVEAFLNAVTKSLKKGEKLTLTGFGTFGVSNRKARVGRNPQTGDDIQITARRVLTFRPSQILKTHINTEKPS